MPGNGFLASRRALLGFMLASALPGAAAAEDPLAVLIELVRERLALMKEVSQAKWNAGSPVEDLAREKSVIESVAALAPAYGLDPALATAFFRAQIAGAHCIESALIARWAAAHAPPFASATDLQATLRPKLDRMTPAMLAALAAAVPEVKRAGVAPIAAASQLDDPLMAVAMARALQPLLALAGARAGAS